MAFKSPVVIQSYAEDKNDVEEFWTLCKYYSLKVTPFPLPPQASEHHEKKRKDASALRNPLNKVIAILKAECGSMKKKAVLF